MSGAAIPADPADALLRRMQRRGGGLAAGDQAKVRAEADHQMPAPRREAVRRERTCAMTDQSKLVPFAAALRRPDPARQAEFAEIARRLQRERALASDVVTNALRDTPRASWAGLAEREELRTSGALERLGQEVERRLETNPKEALSIAELATAIADVLQPDAYPAIM